MIARLALIAAAIVPGHPSHQLLRIAIRDIIEKGPSSIATKHSGSFAVVVDDDLVSALFVVKSTRSGHDPSLRTPEVVAQSG